MAATTAAAPVVVERGVPAYWVTEAISGGTEFVPVKVVSVAVGRSGRPIAIYQVSYGRTGFQTGGEIGTVIVAQAATEVVEGERVIVAPSVAPEEV